MTQEGKYEEQHSITITETTWHERAWKFSRHLPKQIPLFAAVTASFWGVSEVLAEIGGENLSLNDLAIPALLTALVVATYRAFKEYVDYVPDALASESKSAKETYRNGKSGWQFSLAKEMLSKRISEINRTLERVEAGSQYIRPVQMSGVDYLAWLRDRPEILIRLVHAIAVQSTSTLPHVIGRTQGENDLADLKSAVEQLAALYEETAKFELEVRSVVPPVELKTLHQMTFSWSSPVRNGILKFIEVLDAISKLNVKRVQSGQDVVPDFGIEFPPPENINAFSDALDALNASSFR